MADKEDNQNKKISNKGVKICDYIVPWWVIVVIIILILMLIGSETNFFKCIGLTKNNNDVMVGGFNKVGGAFNEASNMIDNLKLGNLFN